jgi:hypothetical protein
MTLVWFMLAAYFGFLVGVLAMTLLRMASLEPRMLEAASGPAAHRRKADLFAGGKRPIPHY